MHYRYTRTSRISRMASRVVNAAIAAKAWWDLGPPEPTYDSSVRAPADNSLPIIVGIIAVVWVAAQVPQSVYLAIGQALSNI